jgi:two-component system phosphate regulon response regulator PhoB
MEMLRTEPWKVLQISGVAACIEHAEACLPDLIVVDGLHSLRFAVDLLHIIRAHEIVGQIGVLVLGASGADEIQALKAGADDFIAMPLPRQSFLLRAEGIVRRTRFTKRFLRYADVTMDVEHRRVFRSGSLIELGPMQFRLLRHFLENPEQAFSLEQLGDVVWSDGASYRTVRTIYAYVHLLREQLNAGGKTDLINTTRGGYCLKSAGDAMLKAALP